MASRGRLRRGRDTKIDEWMKEHTVRDMEDLVAELAAKGEDVAAVSSTVHEFEEMVEEEHDWEQRSLAKARSEERTAA